MHEPWFLYSQQPSPYFISNSFLGIFLSSKWNWMLFVSGVCHPIYVRWCQNSVLLCDRGIFHYVMGHRVSGQEAVSILLLTVMLLYTASLSPKTSRGPWPNSISMLEVAHWYP